MSIHGLIFPCDGQRLLRARNILIKVPDAGILTVSQRKHLRLILDAWMIIDR